MLTSAVPPAPPSAIGPEHPSSAHVIDLGTSAEINTATTIQPGAATHWSLDMKALHHIDEVLIKRREIYDTAKILTFFCLLVAGLFAGAAVLNTKSTQLERHKPRLSLWNISALFSALSLTAGPLVGTVLGLFDGSRIANDMNREHQPPLGVRLINNAQGALVGARRGSLEGVIGMLVMIVSCLTCPAQNNNS